MPTERAIRAARAYLSVIPNATGDSVIARDAELLIRFNLAETIDREASLPALEAVAEAAKALEKEWARLGYYGPLTTDLRAALAKLEEKP